MKCVVTGAAGFAGRALCAELRRRGHHVTAVVRTRGATIDADRVIAAGPIEAPPDWPPILRGADVVFHLAAQVHDVKQVVAPERFHEVNTAATATLVRACRAAGVRRFVFVSTILVHGTDSGAHALREDSATNPRTPYAESKLAAEQAVRDEAGDVEWVIVRPPLVYGPGVKAKFLQLLGIIERGVPLPFGRVTNRRSFIFAANLVDALITVAEAPNARNETFLVADDDAWSTAQLIRELAHAGGTRARLLPFPQWLLRRAARFVRQLDPLLASLEGDTSHVRERLGLRPPFSARDGLRATVEWYRGSAAGRLPRR
jgi:nucleoside-diphosphate-sugar epimerase